MSTYFIPTDTVVFEEEIKHSRFITYLSPAKNKAEAMEFINLIKEEYPDARHHCWAYIAGDPDCTTKVGMTDDGEPHGTAGRPMLGVLKNKNIGEAVTISVRYFGGTKLGTGGLVRAYSGGVLGAVEESELIEKIPLAQILVSVPFSMESHIRRFIAEKNLKILNVEYVNNVRFSLEFPLTELEAVKAELIDTTNGQAIVETIEL